MAWKPPFGGRSKPPADPDPEPTPAAAGRDDRSATAGTVAQFDVWRHRELLLERLEALLTAAGLEFCRLPGRLTLAVTRSEAPHAVAALRPVAAEEGWWAVVDDRRSDPGQRRFADVTTSPTTKAVTVFANLATASGLSLTGPETGVDLEFWRQLTAEGTPRRDGGDYQVGTRIAPRPNGLVSYLEPAQWRAAQAAPNHWPGDRPHLLEVQEPIDLVYTWVDGADPGWQQRKAAAQATAGLGHHPDAFAGSRFADHDELRHSLRSVEMYASWINHIWLVTDGQVPSWLRTDHPKLTVVDHREIFADPGALPVFNSHAIESQLHHIRGLADRFLYLNDDVFFGRPVRPETFFHANGVAKIFVSSALLSLDGTDSRDQPVLAAAKRTRELIEREFGRTLTAKLQHTALPQSRPLLAELEQRYPGIFDTVMRSTFRHPDDYAIPSSLAQYYGYATGRAVVGDLAYGYLDISYDSAAPKLAEWVHTRPFECLCLNDTDSGDLAPEQRDRMLRDFLAAYFPLPSSYEHPR